MRISTTRTAILGLAICVPYWDLFRHVFNWRNVGAFYVSPSTGSKPVFGSVVEGKGTNVSPTWTEYACFGSTGTIRWMVARGHFEYA